MAKTYDPARDDYNYVRDNWDLRVARGEVAPPNVEHLHREAFEILEASGDVAGMRVWAEDQKHRA